MARGGAPAGMEMNQSGISTTGLSESWRQMHDTDIGHLGVRA
jgi:hypothetical protein